MTTAAVFLLPFRPRPSVDTNIYTMCQIGPYCFKCVSLVPNILLLCQNANVANGLYALAIKVDKYFTILLVSFKWYFGSSMLRELF